MIIIFPYPGMKFIMKEIMQQLIECDDEVRVHINISVYNVDIMDYVI